MVRGEQTSGDGIPVATSAVETIDVAITTRLLRAIRAAVVTDSLDALTAALDAGTAAVSFDGDEPGDGPDTGLTVIQALEELKNAISARQAELTVSCFAAQRARDEARNATLPDGRQIDEVDTARLVGSQLGLARRTSPSRGTRLLRLAQRLHADLPNTYAALRAGQISEWQASLVTRETKDLSSEDRETVDAAIAPELGCVSDWRLETTARELALSLDPEAATRRRVAAESGRHVTMRSAADSMARISALLPIADGMAIFTTLDQAASAPEEGDTRTRSQRMADELLARVTGGGGSSPSPGVAVNLLVPLDALTGDTPAYLDGCGPVPADVAREFIEKSGEKLRRIFSAPGSGDLIAMESKARCYPGPLATFIRLRDQRCRSPHCGASITQIDHITPHARGGETSERNGEGYCARCNLVKEHPEMHVGGNGSETTITTGGLRSTSRPPAPPGNPPPVDSRVERRVIDLYWGERVNAIPPAA